MTQKAKNWTIGIVSFFAGVLATIVGFFVLTIYVSFIHEKDAPEDTEEFVTVEEIQAAEDAEALETAMEDYPYHEPFNLGALESRRIELMAPDDIPVGSWWTDGHIYFKVLTNTPDTLYMVGTNLEESCGMEITFVKRNDSTMVTDGASVFAFHNSPVLYDRLCLADGKMVDLLVAFYDPHCITPQAVLQRYHGRGLEKQQILP